MVFAQNPIVMSNCACLRSSGGKITNINALYWKENIFFLFGEVFGPIDIKTLSCFQNGTDV